MTSSNVASLLVKPASKDFIPKQELQPEVKSPDNLFARTLQNVSDLSRSKVTAPTPKTSEKPVDKTKVEIDKTSSVKGIKQDDINGPDMAETVEKVEAVVKEVKEVVKEELDVTDEEIQLVMENLGLIAIDILDPQNLAQIVTELTGAEDSISLVMSEEFANILKDVTELTNQFLKDMDGALPQIKELLIQMQPQDEMLAADIQISEEQLDLTEQKMPVVQSDIPQDEIGKDESSATETVKSGVSTTVKPEEKATTIQENEENPQEVEKDILSAFKVKTDNGEADSDNKDFSFEQKQRNAVFKSGDNQNGTPVIRHEATNPMVQANNELQFLAQEQVVELPTGESVKASDIANQFIEQAKVLTTTESTTMELTLNPEGLGKIFLEVTQKGNEITAKIFTENDAVKQALESQMANLKSEFTQSNTKVTSVEVSVGTHEFERNLDENGREDARREEGRQQSSKRRGRIDITSLDDLTGLMSDEEMLIAQMMKDNGGTLDFMA